MHNYTLALRATFSALSLCLKGSHLDSILSLGGCLFSSIGVFGEFLPGFLRFGSELDSVAVGVPICVGQLLVAGVFFGLRLCFEGFLVEFCFFWKVPSSPPSFWEFFAISWRVPCWDPSWSMLSRSKGCFSREFVLFCNLPRLPLFGRVTQYNM